MTDDAHRPGPFAVKSIDSLLAEAGEEGHSLKRAVGAFSLTAIGLGAIIGTGIFIGAGAGGGGGRRRRDRLVRHRRLRLRLLGDGLDPPPLHRYTAGSHGPQKMHELIAPRRWWLPED